MALLEQIQYTRRKTKVFFPRCSKLIQSPKNSARISQIFSLRLSGSASLFFFHFFHSFWLACKGKLQHLCIKNTISFCSLFLSYGSWLGTQETKNTQESTVWTWLAKIGSIPQVQTWAQTSENIHRIMRSSDYELLSGLISKG